MVEGEITLARSVAVGVFGYWPAKITRIINTTSHAMVKFYGGRAEGEQSVLLTSLRPFPKKVPKMGDERWRRAWQLARRDQDAPPPPLAPNPFQPPTPFLLPPSSFLLPPSSPSSFLLPASCFLLAPSSPPQEEEVPFPSSSPSFSSSSFLQTSTQSSSNPLPPSSSPRRWSGINDGAVKRSADDSAQSQDPKRIKITTQLTEEVFVTEVKRLLKKQNKRFGPWRNYLKQCFPHGAIICGKTTPGALRHHIELYHIKDKKCFPCICPKL